jgi:ketosteroid isomerase-like protein
MSNENVDVVRRTGRLFEAGDMDGLGRLYDPEAVLWHPEGWPEPGPSRGRQAVISQFARLREAWSDTRLVEETLATHREWVIVRWRLVTKGGGSGVLTDRPISGAYLVREGSITEVRFCWDHADALQAAGVSAAGR